MARLRVTATPLFRKEYQSLNEEILKDTGQHAWSPGRMGALGVVIERLCPFFLWEAGVSTEVVSESGVWYATSPCC